MFVHVQTNVNTILYFQADTDDLYRRWITSLQQGISSALHETINKDTTAAGSSESSKLQWEDSDNEDNGQSSAKLKRRGMKPCAKQILLIPGNEKCCDCGKFLVSFFFQKRKEEF